MGEKEQGCVERVTELKRLEAVEGVTCSSPGSAHIEEYLQHL